MVKNKEAHTIINHRFMYVLKTECCKKYIGFSKKIMDERFMLKDSLNISQLVHVLGVNDLLNKKSV